MTAIVVDLDGTLFDHDHRIDFAKSKDWEGYHSRLGLDETHTDVLWLLKVVPNYVQIVFCTGRPEKWRAATISHMRKHDIIIPDELLMRPDNDFSKDSILKPALLEGFFGGKQATLDNVKFVLDDRDSVVEAWRNYGLVCWQVRQGSF